MATTTVETAPAVELLTAPPLPAHLHNERSGTGDGHSVASRIRTFEAAPTTTTTPRSRFLITSVIVGTNIVQFISNFVTIAGGLALSAALGREVGAGQANWMAASYS